MRAVTGRSGSRKHIRHIANLPDDLMHIVFGMLEFRDKINASGVCKQWDQLLKAGTDNARHWVVNYNVDTIVSSSATRTAKSLPPAQRLEFYTERCVTVPFTSSAGKNPIFVSWQCHTVADVQVRRSKSVTPMAASCVLLAHELMF
jgi:hypothetical protein